MLPNKLILISIIASIYLLSCDSVEKRCEKLYKITKKCSEIKIGKNEFIIECKQNSNSPAGKNLLKCRFKSSCEDYFKCVTGADRKQIIKNIKKAKVKK